MRRACALVLACAPGPLLGGCAGGRVFVQVPVRLEASAPVLELDGVEVELEEAGLCFSDLRFLAPAETPGTAWLRSLSPVRAAWAHPGHDFSGETEGELLGEWCVDLLAGPEELGTASLLDGDYATGRFTLAGEPTAALAGTAVLEGGSERPFRFEPSSSEEVRGIPFEVEVLAEEPPSGIVFSVDLAHLLSFADWGTEDEDGDGLLELEDGDLGNTVPFGLLSTPTYALELEP